MFRLSNQIKSGRHCHASTCANKGAYVHNSTTSAFRSRPVINAASHNAVRKLFSRLVGWQAYSPANTLGPCRSYESYRLALFRNHSGERFISGHRYSKSFPSELGPELPMILISGYLARMAFTNGSRRSGYNGPHCSLPIAINFRLKEAGCPISARILPHWEVTGPLANSIKSKASSI